MHKKAFLELPTVFFFLTLATFSSRDRQSEQRLVKNLITT